MNGHRLDGRVIAVRVAGKPPQPAVTPGPPAPPMPTYPTPNQAIAGYPSQQNMSGGSNGRIPPGSYMGAAAPWGAPAPPPPPYAPYAAPPTGSYMYNPVQGQPMVPYSVPYPPPQVAPSSTQSIPSTENHVAPGVQSQNNVSAVSAQPGPNNIYGNAVMGMPPNSQPTYNPSSLGYPSYYTVPPHLPQPGSHAPVDQQNFASGLWASDPPDPPAISSAEQSQQVTAGVDPEYEKFMAEMK